MLESLRSGRRSGANRSGEGSRGKGRDAGGCRLPALAALLIFVAALSPRVAAQSAEGTVFDLPPSEFRALPAAQADLDPATLDLELLAAALFHETNRLRERERLASLEYLPEAGAAAAMQSRLMAEDREVRHENPGSDEMRTLADRVRLAGLEPRFVAENVASGFLLRYRSGEPFYRREERGDVVFSYEPGGAPLPPHSYLTFAQEMLQRWMESPGHRRNILDEMPRYLGTAAEPVRDEAGMWMLYATQVFFTPLDGVPAR